MQLFMSTKTITLSKAVELKTKLETARSEVYEKIKEAYESNNKEEIDKLEKQVDDIIDLILNLHVKIQEINLDKNKRKPNVWWIKWYSELKIRKNLESSIDVKGNTEKQKIKIEKIKQLSEEMNKISVELSTFNTSKKIKISFPETLIKELDIYLG